MHPKLLRLSLIAFGVAHLPRCHVHRDSSKLSGRKHTCIKYAIGGVPIALLSLMVASTSWV